jgi:hypothetical protein
MEEEFRRLIRREQALTRRRQALELLVLRERTGHPDRLSLLIQGQDPARIKALLGQLLDKYSFTDSESLHL